MTSTKVTEKTQSSQVWNATPRYSQMQFGDFLALKRRNLNSEVRCKRIDRLVRWKTLKINGPVLDLPNFTHFA